jgi:putative ABC transport system substrate-binding protein
VVKILNGTKASDIPVEKGKVISLSVNTAAAERMGVTLPQTIIDQAAKVYDE